MTETQSGVEHTQTHSQTRGTIERWRTKCMFHPVTYRTASRALGRKERIAHGRRDSIAGRSQCHPGALGYIRRTRSQDRCGYLRRGKRIPVEYVVESTWLAWHMTAWRQVCDDPFKLCIMHTRRTEGSVLQAFVNLVDLLASLLVVPRMSGCGVWASNGGHAGELQASGSRRRRAWFRSGSPRNFDP